jgi:hypothetical protein
VRIRIIQKPPVTDIDGVDLGYFQPGSVYDVGEILADVFLAEGWAEPLPIDDQAPFDEFDPFSLTPPRRPLSLASQRTPPYREQAADGFRRRRRRSRKP